MKYYVDEDLVEFSEIRGLKIKILVDSSTLGCRNLRSLVSFFPPKMHAPIHFHEKEEEIIYCLEGAGEAIIEDKVIKIKPGITVFFPAGILHSINNTSKNPIKLYCVFSQILKE